MNKKIEVRRRKLEDGSWKFEDGSSKTEARSWKFEDGRWNTEIRSWLMMLFIVLISLSVTSCFSVRYSFSGASIPNEMKTACVNYFPNRAQIVNPNLSQQFTEAFKEKLRSQTKLTLLNDVGDGNFEGEITGYTTSPTAITSGDQPTKNRFTISIRVKYSNAIDPKMNFDKTFSRYEEYDASRNFTDVETEMTKKVIDLLLEDIYNQAFVNW